MTSPPSRRSGPLDKGRLNVDIATDLMSVDPDTANRAALNRRLTRVADDADRRGDAETAGLARFFLAVA